MIQLPVEQPFQIGHRAEFATGLIATFYETPEERRDHLKSLFTLALPLAPRWLQTVNVRMSLQPGDNLSLMIETNVQVEYRHAVMWFYPRFWELSAEDQFASVVHEFVHIPVQQLYICADDIVDAAYPDRGPFQSNSKEQLRRAVEAVVCDLTRSIMELYRRIPQDHA